MVDKSLREQAPYRLPQQKRKVEEKMNYPYFKVSASEETKEIFSNFYNQNKGVFGSKANIFRVMVSNLETLAKVNSKCMDTELQQLEKNFKKAEDKILILEAHISDKKNSESETKQIVEKLNKIEQMIEAISLKEKKDV